MTPLDLKALRRRAGRCPALPPMERIGHTSPDSFAYEFNGRGVFLAVREPDFDKPMHAKFLADYIEATNPDTILTLIDALERAVEGMCQSIAKADDYGDSGLSAPIREAITEIRKRVKL